MGGKGRKNQAKNQGQSTSSNSCNGHSNLYKRLKSRSACFSPSEVPGFRRRGITLLHLAAREEDIALDIAQAILSCGCIPINLQSLDEGWTPLYIASHDGQVDMVKLFLAQEGINVNIREKHMFTSLRAAAQNCHTEVVKLLIASENIDVNLADIIGCTPLHFAVNRNKETVVQTLLTCATIDVNRKGSFGSSPLHDASIRGHDGVVRLLVGHKDIELNSNNNGCSTAISIAAREGHVEVVKVLLGCVGIDINKPNSAGCPPLMLAVMFGHFKVTEMLLESNLIADINVKDEALGRSVLLMAVQMKRPKIVNILLKYKGIDVNQQCTRGYSPLIAGCHSWKLEIFQMLDLDQGVVIETERHKLTALQDLHGSTHRTDIVKALLANKTININAETQSHDTALHVAAGLGNVEVVRLLLDLYKKDKHVDVKKENLAGETALSLAERRNHVEVVKVITKHMKKMERRKQREIKYEAELQEAIAAFDTLE